MMLLSSGKCPKCEQSISQCDMGKVIIGDKTFGPFYNGVSMCCPKCKTVLGISIDPSYVADEVIRRLTEKKSEKTR